MVRRLEESIEQSKSDELQEKDLQIMRRLSRHQLVRTTSQENMKHRLQKESEQEFDELLREGRRNFILMLKVLNLILKIEMLLGTL